MLPKELFKEHRHIGLDLDETLASTFADWLAFAHRRGAVLGCKTVEDIEHHDMFEHERYDITLEDSIKLWHDFWSSLEGPNSTKTVQKSKEGVQGLIDIGKELSIITARNGNDPLKKRITLEWVQYYFPTIQEESIHFVNHYSADRTPKSTICKALGITLLIDDHIENARDLSGVGITTILLEKPWNRNIEFAHPLLYRVKGWQEIVDNLEFIYD